MKLLKALLFASGMIIGTNGASAQADTYSLFLSSTPFFTPGQSASLFFVYAGVTPSGIFISTDIAGTGQNRGRKSVKFPASGGGKRCVTFTSINPTTLCASVRVVSQNNIVITWDELFRTPNGKSRFAGTYNVIKNGSSCQLQVSDLRRTFVDRQNEWVTPFQINTQTCHVEFS